jgi:hypothetical protein
MVSSMEPSDLSAGSHRFPIRLGARSRPLLRLFGVRRQADAYLDVGPEGIDARFGAGHASTPLSNIVSWRIEGPWHWITAIGIRMSVRHRDLSFGGSPHGGVRLDFREPIRVGPLRPPALYASVDDLEGCAAALAALGIPGEDARRHSK